jgi:AcrR family transcriptional regulator
MARLKTKRPGIRAHRRARKQARILTVARALLRDHGHERLSLRHVARRAGISPAGVYEYFADRDDLIDALVGQANEALAASLRAATQGLSDPLERLVELGLAYIRFAREHTTDFLLLYGRRSSRRSLAEDVPAGSEYEAMIAVVRDVVSAGRPDGKALPFLEVLAYGFWSSIHGMAMLQLGHLAGFSADFAGAHRLLLAGMARSWQRADWTKVAGSPATGRSPR